MSNSRTNNPPPPLDIRPPPSPSVKPPRSPRLHTPGEAPPALSPLDALTLQSQLLARRLDESNAEGRRLSRLPPLTMDSPIVVQGRSDYFRTRTHDHGSRGTSPDSRPNSSRSHASAPRGRSPALSSHVALPLDRVDDEEHGSDGKQYPVADALGLGFRAAIEEPSQELRPVSLYPQVDRFSRLPEPADRNSTDYPFAKAPIPSSQLDLSIDTSSNRVHGNQRPSLSIPQSSSTPTASAAATDSAVTMTSFGGSFTLTPLEVPLPQEVSRPSSILNLSPHPVSDHDSAYSPTSASHDQAERVGVPSALMPPRPPSVFRDSFAPESPASYTPPSASDYTSSSLSPTATTPAVSSPSATTATVATSSVLPERPIQMIRKVSNGSQVQGSPVLPSSSKSQRSMSIASEASSIHPHPTRPSFNFSRPISRAETLSMADTHLLPGRPDSHHEGVVPPLPTSSHHDHPPSSPRATSSSSPRHQFSSEEIRPSSSYVYSKFTIPASKSSTSLASTVPPNPPAPTNTTPPIPPSVPTFPSTTEASTQPQAYPGPPIIKMQAPPRSEQWMKSQIPPRSVANPAAREVNLSSTSPSSSPRPPSVVSRHPSVMTYQSSIHESDDKTIRNSTISTSEPYDAVLASRRPISTDVRSAPQQLVAQEVRRTSVLSRHPSVMTFDSSKESLLAIQDAAFRNRDSTSTLGVLPSGGAPSRMPSVRTLDPSQQAAVAGLTSEEHLAKGIECHENGSFQESTYHLRHAARMNNPTGMLLYALACRHGWGMRPNPQEGVDWLRKAAECASEEVADDEEQASGGKFVSFQERKIRKAQFALSIYELGMSHLNGWGVEKDKALALRCFEIAGSWGDVDALAAAGSCYEEGHGCKRDLKKSAKYYRMAEAAGMSMVGNSWIHKAKYDSDNEDEDESKDKKKKRHSKSHRRTLFGRITGSIRDHQRDSHHPDQAKHGDAASVRSSLIPGTPNSHEPIEAKDADKAGHV